jgi:hypothetical protein
MTRSDQGKNPKIIKYIPKEQLIGLSDGFLKKYHPAGELPIPIEDILEIKLKIKVIPLPDLMKNFGIDSFLCSDMARVGIDEKCYNTINRCRFSFAHEIAHFVLHKEFYALFDINNFEEYTVAINAISAEENKRMEQQAYIFAGYLLIPVVPYRKLVDGLVSKVGNEELLSEDDIRYIITETAKIFGVSELAAVKQLKWEYPVIFNNNSN